MLGLPFEEESEAPEWQRLYERREVYRIGVVPESGLFLTAGVDVQKDRIEIEVVAWGRSMESWSVDYQMIEGDTARPDVWEKLGAVLARDWPHASGHTLPIRVTCVAAGCATQDVYAWVRQHSQASWGPAGAAARQPRTGVAVKGRDQDTALLLSVSKADAGGKRRGLRVWSVGTPVAQAGPGRTRDSSGRATRDERQRHRGGHGEAAGRRRRCGAVSHAPASGGGGRFLRGTTSAGNRAGDRPGRSPGRRARGHARLCRRGARAVRPRRPGRSRGGVRRQGDARGAGPPVSARGARRGGRGHRDP